MPCPYGKMTVPSKTWTLSVQFPSPTYQHIKRTKECTPAATKTPTPSSTPTGTPTPTGTAP